MKKHLKRAVAAFTVAGMFVALTALPAFANHLVSVTGDCTSVTGHFEGFSSQNFPVTMTATSPYETGSATRSAIASSFALTVSFVHPLYAGDVVSVDSAWPGMGSNNHTGTFTAPESCGGPPVVAPAASIKPGTCEDKDTVVTLDNSASNVDVTFTINGTPYVVGPGDTQTVDLGTFEGTVTVSAPSMDDVTANVSYAECPVVAPAASIKPGTCEDKDTVVTLDNSASNVDVTFTINGTPYVVGPGDTQTVDLGTFEGTVTVSAPSMDDVTANVSYAECPVVAPAASIKPGTCEDKDTVVTLDNSASNVDVTFTINGTPYVVGPGDTQTVDLGTFEGTVTVSAPSMDDVTANVSYAECATPPPPPPGEPDVQIRKFDSAPATGVAPGESFTFTLSATNTGGLAANGVVITDTIPVGLNITGASFAGGSSSGNCAVTGQNITCNIGIVAPGNIVTVSIEVTATEAACPNITNSAHVSASNEPVANQGNNDSNDVTVLVNCTPPPPPNPGIEVSIAKTNNADGKGGYSDSEEAPQPGSAVPFLVVITNTGTPDITLTSLVDTFDAQTIDLISGPCSQLAGMTLTSGQSVACNFTLKDYSPPAASPGKINTAEVCAQSMDATTAACDRDDSKVTSNQVKGKTVTPPVKTPPGGTAFTGSSGTVSLALFTLVLLLLGSGLVFLSNRRRRQAEGI